MEFHAAISVLAEVSYGAAKMRVRRETSFACKPVLWVVLQVRKTSLVKEMPAYT